MSYVNTADGNMDIWVMNADGSNKVRLTWSSAREWFPFWTPDDKIIFFSRRAGKLNMYLLDPNTMQESILLRETIKPLAPHLSPDGTMLAFENHIDKIWSLWVFDLLKQSLTKIYESKEDRGGYCWKRNSRQIIFSSGFRLWLIDIDGNNLSRLPVENMYCYFPSCSPDGKKLAFVGKKEGYRNNAYDIWVASFK